MVGSMNERDTALARALEENQRRSQVMAETMPSYGTRYPGVCSVPACSNQPDGRVVTVSHGVRSSGPMVCSDCGDASTEALSKVRGVTAWLEPLSPGVA